MQLVRYALAALACATSWTAAAWPAGVKAVWDSARAFRESTATRERLCVNGLRRWLDGLYLDVPAEWDDRYRFFRW
jgi:hypothetical protein